jgi:RNA polymerase-interacting CarD/CdnL/TRCF family regulator
LNFPQTDGLLAPITFHSASVVDFNQAVADLKQRIVAANQQASDAQALQQAEHKLDQEAAAVNSDVAGLAQQSPLTSAEQLVGSR